MNEFILFQTFNTRIEAEIVKGKLESNGIKTFISGDDQGGMSPFPFQPASTGVQLHVLEKDIRRAKEIVKE